MAKRNTRRTLLYLGLGLVVLGALLYGFWPKAIPVNIVSAVEGPLVVTVEDEGRTRIQNRYVIRSPMVGFAERITLDAGDPVRKGQTLAVLRPPRAGVLDPAGRAQAEAQVAAARATLKGERERLAAARADARFTTEERARAEQLFQQDVIAKQALQQARTAAQRALANVEAGVQAVAAAEQQVEAARSMLRYAGQPPGDAAPRVELASPIDGRVLQVQEESEGPVQPGQVLVSVGDPDDLEIVVDVLSDEAVRIAPGMRVRIRSWGGNEALSGTVRHIEPQAFTKVSALGVEEQRVNVIVGFESAPETWASLGDNYRVIADFVLWSGRDVLQIPRNAVFPVRGGHAVFLVREGRADLHPVKIGRQNGLYTQILSGLATGDQVISHPDERIRDGIRVEAQPVTEPATENMKPETSATNSAGS